MNITSDSSKNKNSPYFSKKLLINYLNIKDLEYKLQNSCITDCLDLNQHGFCEKEQECLKICQKNMIEFFKISAKNYEESQKFHNPQTFKQSKRISTTESFD